MKKYILLPLLIFPYHSIQAVLVPQPMINGIQRVTRDMARENTNGNSIFNQPDGLAGVVINENPKRWLLVSPDVYWDRITYGPIKEKADGTRELSWIKAFGSGGSGSSHFSGPKGVCIDTTIYSGHPNDYYIYVADSMPSLCCILRETMG